MVKTKLFITICTLFLFVFVSGQSLQSLPESDSTQTDFQGKELKGFILDRDKQSPLPYANIYVLRTGKGSISNEKGSFSIDITTLNQNDTLRFQYIGYKTRNITVGQLDTSEIVYLKEDIINLSETIIFGRIPDLKEIVKNVLVYKDSNYKKTTSKRQTFIRDRETADISDFELKYKKSTIDELDREMIKTIEDRTPKYVTSYTDFLGYYYFNKNKDDTIRRKVDPIRMVSLEEDYLEDLQQLETLFEGILASTGEDEYWKVKSGIFGQKLDLENDTVKAAIDSIKDNRNRRRASSYGWNINYRLAYTSLEDKDHWEFLHKPGRYNYTLVGGTRVNDEDVYIIDFEPNRSGSYIGRMFVAMESYALIRADYDYAPGKIGRDIHLLGVGFTETRYGGSIFFEKKGDNYKLKYFSNHYGYTASIDRSLALKKKKKRWLFDKNLKELKVGLNLVVKAEESVEFLVLDETEITHAQFTAFKQPKYIEEIFVEQFDDDLWKGFSIIEPTEQMKDYRKQQENPSN